MVSPTPAEVLRVALAMRGGVSLSVWIGGAVNEIDTLRRQLASGDRESTLALLADKVLYTSLEVDVITGASAGGLNGVILAAAMASGADVARLREVWLDDADLQKLLFPSGWRTRRSVLDGEFFRRRLQYQLARLATSGDSGSKSAERVDLILSVTSIVPNPVEARTDPSAPVVERRMDGLIHLHHRNQEGVAERNRYSDFRDVQTAIQRDETADIALAAQSTASFPVAFAPVRGAGLLRDKLEFRPRRPDPLFLYDGGVTDNMPVGKAVRAIDQAAAGERTERVLIYLHPNPDAPDSRAQSKTQKALAAMQAGGPRAIDVIQGVMKSLRTESLIEDLRELEGHNARAGRHLRDRDRQLDLFRKVEPDELVAHDDPESRVHLDVERLVNLLIDPWDHLDGLLPIPEREALLVGRSADFLQVLHAELHQKLVQLLQDQTFVRRDLQLPRISRGSVRPWSPVIRVSSLLIEWCRYLERRRPSDQEPGALKRHLYEVRARAYEAASAMNRDTLDQPSLAAKRIATIGAADLAQRLVELRQPIAAASVDEVASAWHALGGTASEITTLARRRAPSNASDPSHHLASTLSKTIDGPPPRDPQAVLDALDIALLPVHRGAPAGSLDRIRFLTLSGSADSPLSDGFPWPRETPPPEISLRSLRPLDTQEVDIDAVPRRKLDPGTKLAGNQLHNFSAFLDRGWRANDWMWGQADAAATLIDLLLEPRRARFLTADDVESILYAPLAEPDGGWPTRWEKEMRSAIGSLWKPRTKRAVAKELDFIRKAYVEGEPEEETKEPPTDLAIPGITRTVLLWRRHLEIVASELARRGNDNSPAGKDTRSLPLTEAFQAWDEAPRRLSERWGDTKTSALGMRAAFVAWKALFARTGKSLGLVRTVLAPILAAAVGFALGRRRSLLATELFLLGAVLPRTHDSIRGRITIGILGGLVAVLGILTTRRVRPDKQGTLKRPLELGEPCALLAIAGAIAISLGAILINYHKFVPYLPHDDFTGLKAYAAPVGATALATFLTWFWARWGWRIVVTGLTATVAGSWVWLGNHPAEVRTWCVFSALNAIGSFGWAIVAIGLLSTLIGYNFDVAQYRRKDASRPNPWLGRQRFHWAHQGGSCEAPSNTMCAFENAKAKGNDADGLEMDVHLTKDGLLVLAHDPSLQRTTNGEGLISEHTLADLRKLDAAYWWVEGKVDDHNADPSMYTLRSDPNEKPNVTMASLTDVMDAFNMPLTLEIKAEAAVEPFVRLLEARDIDLDNLIVTAFSDRTVSRIRQLAPDVPLAPAKWWQIRFFLRTLLPWRPLRDAPFVAIQSPYRFEAILEGLLPKSLFRVTPKAIRKLRLINRRFVEYAHHAGMAVHAWTINDSADMEELLALNVDGIMTDFPSRLSGVLRRKPTTREPGVTIDESAGNGLAEMQTSPTGPL